MKTTLLRRFRWPIFVAVFSGIHVAVIAYLYEDPITAGIAFLVTLFAVSCAVVLNTIDETSNKFEQ